MSHHQSPRQPLREMRSKIRNLPPAHSRGLRKNREDGAPSPRLFTSPNLRPNLLHKNSYAAGTKPTYDGADSCALPLTDWTGLRPLQWHHKREGAMPKGHCATGLEGAGQSIAKSAIGRYVLIELSEAWKSALTRWPDNKKNRHHFQTPSMAPQKRGSHA